MQKHNGLPCGHLCQTHVIKHRKFHIGHSHYAKHFKAYEMTDCIHMHMYVIYIRTYVHTYIIESISRHIEARIVCEQNQIDISFANYAQSSMHNVHSWRARERETHINTVNTIKVCRVSQLYQLQ